jgi:formate dehydrogenase (NADP+) beta subunit
VPARGPRRPVSIRALKRFVCERFGVESSAFDLGRVYPQLRDPRRERLGEGRKVAVVGAGPAGLSCAHELALMGFAPTVFEGQNLAGGMLVLGVPEYRLPREIVRAEIAAIEALGVEIRLNSRLGGTLPSPTSRSRASRRCSSASAPTRAGSLRSRASRTTACCAR